MKNLLNGNNLAPPRLARFVLRWHLNIKMRGEGEMHKQDDAAWSWWSIVQVVQDYFHPPFQIFDFQTFQKYVAHY